MATVAPPLPSTHRRVKPIADSQRRVAQALLLLACAALVVFLLAPLASILVKSVQDKDGAFIGLAQFRAYLGSPALLESAWNTLWIATVVTLITIPHAFTYAYA